MAATLLPAACPNRVRPSSARSQSASVEPPRSRTADGESSLGRRRNAAMQDDLVGASCGCCCRRRRSGDGVRHRRVDRDSTRDPDGRVLVLLEAPARRLTRSGGPFTEFRVEHGEEKLPRGLLPARGLLLRLRLRLRARARPCRFPLLLLGRHLPSWTPCPLQQHSMLAGSTNSLRGSSRLARG